MYLSVLLNLMRQSLGSPTSLAAPSLCILGAQQVLKRPLKLSRLTGASDLSCVVNELSEQILIH